MKNIDKTLNYETVELKGTKYITVSVMAQQTGKAESTIYKLCSLGNKTRRMKHIKIGNSILIDETEINDFPFGRIGV